MIYKVKIKDNTKTPFEYASDIEAFENSREFIFKPGVNVIIGKNGSGKSTLLNIISMYALCEKSMCSEIPIEALDFPPIFDDDDKVLDGIDISSDYAGKVFRLLPSEEMNRDRVLKYVYNIKQERSYNNDLVGIFERYKDIADGDMEVAMNFIKEAYPFNEETESFIRKKFDMPIPDESKEQ